MVKLLDKYSADINDIGCITLYRKGEPCQVYDMHNYTRDAIYQVAKHEETITNLTEEKDNLLDLLQCIKDDLLERAEIDSDKFKVVNLGASNWIRLKKVLESHNETN